MLGVADFHRSLDELERIQHALGDIARRTDDGRAQDLIDGRRALMQQFTLVAEQGVRAFGPHGPEVLREFRSRFSAMRAGISHLQASWPAVKMRDDMSGDYARAVAIVREADTTCIAWIRTTLARLEGTR